MWERWGEHTENIRKQIIGRKTDPTNTGGASGRRENSREMGTMSSSFSSLFTFIIYEGKLKSLGNKILKLGLERGKLVQIKFLLFLIYYKIKSVIGPTTSVSYFFIHMIISLTRKKNKKSKILFSHTSLFPK